MGPGPHVIRGSLRQPADPYPRSIGSAVFVGLTMVTNRQTDRQTDRATIFHKSSELGYRRRNVHTVGRYAVYSVYIS